MGEGIDTSLAGRAASTPLGPVRFAANWVGQAACRGADAPGMFADRWGIGREARRNRAAALAACRRCPVRLECGQAALADVDAGMSLYGVLCGIEFTDVTPSRQGRDIVRLRSVVASLDGVPAAPVSIAGRSDRPTFLALEPSMRAAI